MYLHPTALSGLSCVRPNPGYRGLAQAPEMLRLRVWGEQQKTREGSGRLKPTGTEHRGQVSREMEATGPGSQQGQ